MTLGVMIWWGFFFFLFQIAFPLWWHFLLVLLDAIERRTVESTSTKAKVRTTRAYFDPHVAYQRSSKVQT
jgi:hypothetical protein